MNTRAKLTVINVDRHTSSENITLSAVYDSKNSPEDNSYASATPYASFTLGVTNPNLFGQFKVGQKYYVDLSLIEEETQG